MTMIADELLRSTSRTDSGNMVSGDGHLLPLRKAITLSPTLGQSDTQMVTGEAPLLPQPQGAVEAVQDSRTTIPGEGRQL